MILMERIKITDFLSLSHEVQFKQIETLQRHRRENIVRSRLKKKRVIKKKTKSTTGRKRKPVDKLAKATKALESLSLEQMKQLLGV